MPPRIKPPTPWTIAVLAAIPAPAWNAIIGAIVTIVVAWIAQRGIDKVTTVAKEVAQEVAVVADKTAVVADKTAVVADKTAAKVEQVLKVSAQTHALVNSESLIAVKLHALTSKRLAAITKDPEDEAAADLAEKMVLEHEAAQAKLNKEQP